MANIKISALPEATALTGEEIVPIVQDGVTKRVPAGQIKTRHHDWDLQTEVAAAELVPLEFSGMELTPIFIDGNTYVSLGEGSQHGTTLGTYLASGKHYAVARIYDAIDGVYNYVSVGTEALTDMVCFGVDVTHGLFKTGLIDDTITTIDAAHQAGDPFILWLDSDSNEVRVQTANVLSDAYSVEANAGFISYAIDFDGNAPNNLKVRYISDMAEATGITPAYTDYEQIAGISSAVLPEGAAVGDFLTTINSGKYLGVSISADSDFQLITDTKVNLLPKDKPVLTQLLVNIPEDYPSINAAIKDVASKYEIKLTSLLEITLSQSLSPVTEATEVLKYVWYDSYAVQTIGLFDYRWVHIKTEDFTVPFVIEATGDSTAAQAIFTNERPDVSPPSVSGYFKYPGRSTLISQDTLPLYSLTKYDNVSIRPSELLFEISGPNVAKSVTLYLKDVDNNDQHLFDISVVNLVDKSDEEDYVGNTAISLKNATARLTLKGSGTDHVSKSIIELGDSSNLFFADLRSLSTTILPSHIIRVQGTSANLTGHGIFQISTSSTEKALSAVSVHVATFFEISVEDSMGASYYAALGLTPPEEYSLSFADAGISKYLDITHISAAANGLISINASDANYTIPYMPIIELINSNRIISSKINIMTAGSMAYRPDYYDYHVCRLNALNRLYLTTKAITGTITDSSGATKFLGAREYNWAQTELVSGTAHADGTSFFHRVYF